MGATLREAMSDFRDRVMDMHHEMQILMYERDTAQQREEDMFEQMRAMTGVNKEAADGYPMDKLLMEASEEALRGALGEEEKRRKAFKRLFSAIQEQPENGSKE